MTMATDTRTVEELKAAVIAGDTTITASQIEKARQAEEFAELQAQAERAKAQRDRVAELDADVATFKADYAEFAGADLSELRGLYDEAVVIVAELHDKVKARVAEQREMEERERTLERRAKELRELGLDASTGRGRLIDNSQGEWTRIAVRPEDVDGIAHEAKFGFVPGGGGLPTVHALHSDERRDDMLAIRASGYVQGTGRELLEAFIARHNAEPAVEADA
ncbi:hypothetical protein FND50_12645 [Rhodococcus sp. WB9]|uniref:hypothetical protein n=1 Tax=Rhodococcus sp. WB9 TaxID=2594007 RepID=UPI0011871045|nr:hypothetical protein [Rhodococcus sp. WB9]QDQ91582.1 hypothetical protein FND50_12645 [Rhodococcus sp. WB9]